MESQDSTLMIGEVAKKNDSTQTLAMTLMIQLRIMQWP